MEDGARTQIYLSASPEIKQKRISGKYFHPITTEVEPAAPFASTGSTYPERLYDFSEELLNKIN